MCYLAVFSQKLQLSAPILWLIINRKHYAEGFSIAQKKEGNKLVVSGLRHTTHDIRDKSNYGIPNHAEYLF